MTDILERLRDPEQGLTGSDRFHLHKDAAAEIERLRVAKREFSKAADAKSYENVGLRAENEKLRAALAACKKLLPILEAVRLSAGLNGNQLTRITLAREAIEAVEHTNG